MDGHRQLGFLLKDVSGRYARRFEERARILSLTLPQCRMLVYLESNEGVSQKRLAELTELDPMTVVRILDRMEADGWVQRRFDPADRRAHTLWLTAHSRPVLEHIARLICETRAEALQGLADHERAKLLELLERVHANLASLPALGPERLEPLHLESKRKTSRAPR